MAGLTIAVASGKGGAGKTTVATALAVALGRGLAEAQFLDCDVEEPDGALFIKPEIEASTEITIDAPEVDRTACDGCGKCQKACEFNAIRIESGKAAVYDGLCLGCGCCRLACPQGAIAEKKKRIGVVETGKRGDIVFSRGLLDVGEGLTSAIIHGLKAMARGDIPTILDCGPGTSSPVIASLKGCDYCLLVTEPTPFGLCDLGLMLRVATSMSMPCGIVVNKYQPWSPTVDDLASEWDVPILMRIPFRREIAHLCSRGLTLPEVDAFWDDTFWKLFDDIGSMVWKGR